MAVTLKKGQGVSLKKSEHDLSVVTIGLGWDIAEEKKKGFLGSLLGKKAEDYDLDVIAFMCGANGKVIDQKSDVVFYNNMRHPSGCLWLTGDNRTGAGDGDDEQIIIRLNDVSDVYKKIVFIVQIYEGQKKGQNFGGVKNAFIRAVDNRNNEMARFDLSGGPSFAQYRSLLFAELVRETGGWSMNAIGSPEVSDSFTSWLRHYS
jgi:stress response protein SCP2